MTAFAVLSFARLMRRVSHLSLLSISVQATSAAHIAAQKPADLEDSVFVAVIRSLTGEPDNQNARILLTVDPRPLLPDDQLRSVTPASFASTSAALIARRRHFLQAWGIDEADATFPPDCAGVLVPDPPNGSAHAGCPQTSRRVAAISLARARALGGTHARGSLTRAVRVVIAGIGPEGISAEVRDYILSNQHGWTVVKFVVLGYWE